MVSRQARMLAFWVWIAVCSAPYRSRQSMMRLLSATFLLTLSVVAGAAAAAPQQVEIPAGKLDLHAQLYKPDGNGPFPVVIALHGCGGLSNQTEQVAPRYSDWTELLTKAGYAVLWPD